MGITGLLPFLKKIHAPVNIKQFEGCTVAVDSYCWLHKGAFSCAEKLALGEHTEQYVYYCMKYINYMLSYNIKPIMVFDGCRLPSKREVEKSRREQRDVNRKKAAQFLREGKRAEARECFQRCVDITSQMALKLMNACRAKGVDCIVAPYEADAQIAYLTITGIAQLVVTEDSDLLLFGCDRIIFKMDFCGNGLLIEQKRLNEVMGIAGTNYSFEKFRRMCILSGCDYLPSLPGIGLSTACKIFKLARQPDLRLMLKKLSTYTKKTLMVTDEYIDGFIKAENTFLYQLAFDPLKRKLVPLTTYPPEISPDDVTYAGPYMPNEKALQIALGNLDIYTSQPISNFTPVSTSNKSDLHHLLSIWDKYYKPRGKLVLTDSIRPNRAQMSGKEITVKNTPLLRRSPRKRKISDCEDSRTNVDLAEMYNYEPNTLSLMSGYDGSGDADTDMMSGIDTESDTQPTEDEYPQASDDSAKENFIDTMTPLEYPTHHEEVLFSDCKSTDEYKTPDMDGDTKDWSLHTSDTDIVQKVVSPPSKNLFATSAEKKPRFNINARKVTEVRSRFFAPKKKKVPTATLR